MTIRYTRRLGDVLRCLPACQYLAKDGPVYFDCRPEYHGVFDMVSYVEPGLMGEVLDLEIWPSRFYEYKYTRKSWTDFVYAHPLLRGADKTSIVLDRLDDEPAKDLPKSYSMVAPFGISQGTYIDPKWLIEECLKTHSGCVVLCPPGMSVNGVRSYTAPSVEQMAKAIRGAESFWCINSAPVVLASAVRRGKETIFWGQLGEYEADNIFHFPGLIRQN